MSRRFGLLIGKVDSLSLASAIGDITPFQSRYSRFSHSYSRCIGPSYELRSRARRFIEYMPSESDVPTGITTEFQNNLEEYEYRKGSNGVKDP